MGTDKKTGATKRTASRKPKAANGSEGRSTKRGSGDRVGALLKKFEEQINGGEFKISVGDYLKLLQFKRDREDNEPKRVEVTWIDSLENTHAIDE